MLPHFSFLWSELFVTDGFPWIVRGGEVVPERCSLRARGYDGEPGMHRITVRGMFFGCRRTMPRGGANVPEAPALFLRGLLIGRRRDFRFPLPVRWTFSRKYAMRFQGDAGIVFLPPVLRVPSAYIAVVRAAVK